MKPTRAQCEQATLAGASARQAGRKEGSCPLYGHGEFGEMLREYWRDGFNSEDERIKAARERSR